MKMLINFSVIVAYSLLVTILTIAALSSVLSFSLHLGLLSETLEKRGVVGGALEEAIRAIAAFILLTKVSKKSLVLKSNYVILLCVLVVFYYTSVEKWSTVSTFRDLYSLVENSQVPILNEPNFITLALGISLSIILHFMMHFMMFFLSLNSLLSKSLGAFLIIILLHGSFNLIMSFLPIDMAQPFHTYRIVCVKFVFVAILFAVFFVFRKYCFGRAESNNWRLGL